MKVFLKIKCSDGTVAEEFLDAKDCGAALLAIEKRAGELYSQNAIIAQFDWPTTDYATTGGELVEVTQ